MFGPPISWHVLVTKESGRRRMNTSEDLEVGRRKKYSGLLAGCKLQPSLFAKAAASRVRQIAQRGTKFAVCCENAFCWAAGMSRTLRTF